MNTLSNNAALAEEIESIVTKYKSYEEAYLLKNPEVMDKVRNNEAFLEQSIEQYQYILLAMFGKATAMLTRVRGDNDELRLKLIEAENLIELKSIDINNLSYEINKLKDRHQRMMKNEEELKYEIQRLNSALNQKNRDMEETQIYFQEIYQQLQQSREILAQQNSELSSKLAQYKTLISQSALKNEQLQADLCRYRNNEDKIENNLAHIQEEYCHENQILHKQIQEKNEEIYILEGIITQVEEQAQEQRLEKTESLSGLSDKRSSIASPAKFTQLFQQLNLKSMTLIPLESVTENKLREESIDQSLTESVENFTGQMRKASSVRDQHHSLEEKPQNTKSCALSPIQSTEQIQTDGSGIHVKMVEPQYMHYLLLAQTIKLQEDEEDTRGLLDIDMKPYYKQLEEKNVQMRGWPQWIKNKLLTLS